MVVNDLDTNDLKSITDAITGLLLEQKENRVERGFYWENQIAFAYNSERIEGNPLTKEQTRMIFETETIGGNTVSLDSVQEMKNHFRLFDYMLSSLPEPLSKELMWEYHTILKSGTTEDLDRDDIVVGGWKTIPNAVGNIQTSPPAQVDAEITRLLSAYSSKENKTYRDIVGFHAFFERIHPFQDGNGRVGRMIMFRECIANSLIPFIVLDESKQEYYKCLQTFDSEPDAFINYALDMSNLYYEEFASLIPQHLLLPRYTEFLPQERNHALDAETFYNIIPAGMTEVAVGTPVAQEQSQAATTPAKEQEAAKRSAGAQVKNSQVADRVKQR